MPAIVWWNHRHFVVLEGAKDGKFYVNDPALGPQKYTQEYFDRFYSGAVISFTAGPDFRPGGQKYKVLPKLLMRLQGSRSGIVFAFIAGLLAMLPGLLLAPASSTFVNTVLEQGNRNFLAILLVTLVVVGVTRAALISLEYRALAQVQVKVAASNNAQFVLRMFRLPILFFGGRNVGDLVQRMGYSSAVAQLLAGQLASSLISMVAIVAYVILMVVYNWWLAIIVVLLATVNVVALRAVVKRRTVGQGLLMSESGHLQSITIGTVQSIETVKASGLEDEIFRQWTTQQVKVVSAEASFVTPTAIISAVPTVITMLTSMSILVFGGIAVVKGSLSLGGLLAFQALAAGITAPVTTLVSTASQIQTIQTDLERLDDALSYPVDPRFASGQTGDGNPSVTSMTQVRSASTSPLTGQLTMTGVQFGYTTGEPPMITGLDLTLEPGHRVALVGPSGAGKTTIGNLVAGLFLPTSGTVTYDGKQRFEIDQQCMSQGLAKVDQNIMLFAGTVRQNVTMWDDSVPDELVIAALRDAQILDQILARPNGINTVVIEGGLNFSSGETQRLEIARALVRNPAILVMDEATSELDTGTEKAMDDAVRARGCSTVIIAHRLSTIRDADEIIVLGRGGSIVERGTNDELLAANGEYAKLVADSGKGGDVGT
jgi:ABC-type branched-subunit amino acid transport system ATPase component